ncbi:MAG: pyridoxamine 5'-phosphate oxidase family protein [Candidatus Altiarchaeota archaeon]|nr:pyridoxamine 5'-phosphate oxidase family protein [Candidatus Altiarchaeota archaeon]
MEDDIKNRINEVLTEQKLGVLSTEYEGQPYASLVAFASTPDLRSLLFATDRVTRKYQNISVNPMVALLVDNRSNNSSDFSKAVAVTASGRAIEVSEKDRELSNGFLLKHPALSGFLSNSATALMKIDVENYVVVEGLKKVSVTEIP